MSVSMPRVSSWLDFFPPAITSRPKPIGDRSDVCSSTNWTKIVKSTVFNQCSKQPYISWRNTVSRKVAFTPVPKTQAKRRRSIACCSSSLQLLINSKAWICDLYKIISPQNLHSGFRFLLGSSINAWSPLHLSPDSVQPNFWTRLIVKPCDFVECGLFYSSNPLRGN